MREYVDGTWEKAAIDIIMQKELQHPLEYIQPYAPLFDSGMYDVIARVAWMELSDSDLQPDDLVELLASKQHDYGSKNILKFGERGILVRLWDKISRYDNLSKRYTAYNESVRDTLSDMIGYVVLLYMVRAGVFTLPLECDL